MAEDNEIRDKLAEHDLHVQTISEVAPIEVSQHQIETIELISESFDITIYTKFALYFRFNQLVYLATFTLIWVAIRSSVCPVESLEMLVF